VARTAEANRDRLRNGTTVTIEASRSSPTSEPRAIVGQRDFDGDGYADLLWHDTSGNVAIWEHERHLGVKASNSFVGNMPDQLEHAGTGDFNGDGGRPPVAGHVGNVAIGEMNGTHCSIRNSSSRKRAGPRSIQRPPVNSTVMARPTSCAGHIRQSGDMERTAPPY